MLKTRSYRIMLYLLPMCLLIGIFIGTRTAFAASPEEDFTFDDSTGTITGYTGPGGDVVIPDEVGEVSVTAIGQGAFQGKTLIKSVVIPESVVSIGSSAFYGCTSLESVNIPSGVTSIAGHTFYNCSKLQSITIPYGVTSIGLYAFYGCRVLESVTIPNSVTEIGTRVFQGCRALTSITIPDSVAEIGSFAFNTCVALTSITIPNSVTLIAEYAFANCTALKSARFLGDAPTIGTDVFTLTSMAFKVYYLRDNVGFPGAAGGTWNGYTAFPLVTVTYNGNGNTGGSVPVDDKLYEQAQIVTVSDNSGELVKTGYPFAGWNTAADGSGVSYSTSDTFAIATKADVTLYAQWTEMFTVTWRSQDGITVYQTDTVARGSSPEFNATEPSKEDTTQYNYTFIGWATIPDQTSGVAEDELPAVTGNTTYYAAFSETLRSYTATYHYNYGSEGVYTAQANIPYGSTIEAPVSDPLREHYTFTGWYKETACATSWDFESDTVTGPTNLHAGWTPADPAAGLVAYWSFDEGFAADVGGDGYTLVPHGEDGIPQLGRFKGRNSVSFERENGHYLVTDVSDVLILSGGESFTYMAWYYLAEPITEGRYFVLETNNASYPLSYGLRPNAGTPRGQVYAQSGGSFYLDNAAEDHGASSGKWHNIIVTYDRNSHDRIAYINGQWGGGNSSESTADLEGLVVGAQRRSEPDARFWDGFIDEVAIWNRVLSPDEIDALQTSQVFGQPTYTVSYNGNGHTAGGAPNDPAIYEVGATVTVAGPGSMGRAGHIFAGWNTAANGSGVSYAAGDTFAIETTGNVTFYAQWTEMFTVTWKSQDGITEYQTGTIASGSSPEFNGAEPSKDDTAQYDYTFVGWATIPDQTSGVAEDDLPAVAGNITYYAAFSETLRSYVATYYYNYGSEGVYVTQLNVCYGTKLTVPVPAPTRTNHSFAGWYKEAGCETPWDFANDTIVGTTSLFAKWTEKMAVSIVETPQTVTYDGSGKAFTISGTPNEGFAVTYNQGSGDVTPVNVGTYHVVISRVEDETYLPYSITITGGLVIDPVVVSTRAVEGITVPVRGGTPVTGVTETAQYRGTVTWSPAHNPFAANTAYTATITLTAKDGYTFTGVVEDYFTVAGATTVSNGPDSGTITAVFPTTGAVVVDIDTITGITVPVRNGVPVSTITETAQYTGTVTWNPDHSRFGANTVYTATITLTPKTGYTLNGVTEDYFIVVGATTVTNATDSGVITATFPATQPEPYEDDDYDDNDVPPEPTYHAEVREEQGWETTLPVTVNNADGTASVDLSIRNGSALNGTVISVPSIPNVNTYSVGIPVPDLSTSGVQGTMTLNTGAGSITVPSNMLTGVEGTEGSRAQITIGDGNKSALPQDVRDAMGDKPLVQLTLSIDGRRTEWSNPEAPVTVSIPYTPTDEELENPESIIVWYVDGGGNVVTIPNGRYDAATGCVVVDVIHFSNYLVAYNPVGFVDVAADAWYGKAVSFIAARSITDGTGNGEYSPGARLTRGEFIVLTMRAYGIDPDANPADNFDDAGDTYYTGYLAAARRLGISTGVGENLYAPGKEITRQEMFTLLYNALRVVRQLPRGDSGRTIEEFVDAEDIASWALEAMTLLVKTGAVSGHGGNLNPLSTTTRAEMAQVLFNLLGHGSPVAP